MRSAQQSGWFVWHRCDCDYDVSGTHVAETICIIALLAHVSERGRHVWACDSICMRCWVINLRSVGFVCQWVRQNSHHGKLVANNKSSTVAYPVLSGCCDGCILKFFEKVLCTGGYFLQSVGLHRLPSFCHAAVFINSSDFWQLCLLQLKNVLRAGLKSALPSSIYWTCRCRLRSWVIWYWYHCECMRQRAFVQEGVLSCGTAVLDLKW